MPRKNKTPDSHPGGPVAVPDPRQLQLDAPPQLPAIPLPAMPLYQIEAELLELLTLEETLRQEHADAEASSDNFALEITAEARQATAARIAQYVQAEIKKVDGIAYTIRECGKRARIAAEEAGRLRARAAMWDARSDRIKQSALRAMQSFDPPITRLETPLNRLRIQNNGGLAPLDVYAPDSVPMYLRKYTITCTGAQMTRLREWADTVGDAEIARLLAVAPSEPDNDAMRAALEMRVICPACDGVLDVTKGCERCGNTGTVPAETPGCRMQARGVHLRVE